MIAPNSKSYSARVDLRLRVNGQILDVAQVGHRFLILRETCEVPPETEAELAITVDGEESVHAVFLHEGIVADSKTVHFS